ncbi:hypothetical protein M8C17_01270 [Micromonospora sp. RHAY321]|uniref:hypothetical protein n=1 Tax=Micromonospora sp. RHAY321 TaxID=2944807 RepID=UPI00207D16A2|nr:hypothetical protein [Micromonospora sp. RHAY321]MCO1593790.1 hypothetical protein [Micromonospora sp. RHAY321]
MNQGGERVSDLPDGLQIEISSPGIASADTSIVEPRRRDAAVPTGKSDEVLVGLVDQSQRHRDSAL